MFFLSTLISGCGLKIAVHLFFTCLMYIKLSTQLKSVYEFCYFIFYSIFDTGFYVYAYYC
jgi:hypothetical protein